MLHEDTKRLNPKKDKVEYMGPILIIGNAPNVLDDKKGRKIDRFKGKIARCNYYEIEGYEQHVGTKTDIWIASTSEGHKNASKDYHYVLLYQTGPDGGLGLRANKKANPKNTIGIFPFNAKDLLKKKLGLIGRREPSTGIVGIYWFISTGYNPVYIYGFDFFDSGSEYFKKERIDLKEKEFNAKFHDGDREKLYVYNLIKENKVKWFK